MAWATLDWLLAGLTDLTEVEVECACFAARDFFFLSPTFLSLYPPSPFPPSPPPPLSPARRVNSLACVAPVCFTSSPSTSRATSRALVGLLTYYSLSICGEVIYVRLSLIAYNPYLPHLFLLPLVI